MTVKTVAIVECIRVRGLNGHIGYETVLGHTSYNPKKEAVTKTDDSYVNRTLKHYKQTEKWDCGLACVCMVIR